MEIEGLVLCIVPPVNSSRSQLSIFTNESWNDELDFYSISENFTPATCVSSRINAVTKSQLKTKNKKKY